METQVTPDAPVKKCELGKIFTPSFVELMKSAPNNEMVRGHILKTISKMPPASESTFEKLKDWIEASAEPIKSNPAPVNGSRRNRQTGISVDIDFNETEVGRADYSVNRSGSDSFNITVDELNDLINEQIEEEDFDLDEIESALKELIGDEIYDRTSPDMKHFGDYDYGGYNPTDTINSDWDISDSRQLRRGLESFIQQNHPDSAERFGL